MYDGSFGMGLAISIILTAATFSIFIALNYIMGFISDIFDDGSFMVYLPNGKSFNATRPKGWKKKKIGIIRVLELIGAILLILLTLLLIYGVITIIIM